MAYDQLELIHRVRNLLEATHDFYGNLTSGVNDTATTIPVNDGTDWEEGDTLEFQSDGELARVRSVSSNNLTVVRAAFGTIAAAKTSGENIIKNPAVPQEMVKDSIEATFRGLWPIAWKVGTTSLTPDASVEWYDSDESIIDLISVYQVYGSNPQKLGIFGDKGGTRPVIFSKNLPTDLVATGKGIGFPGGIFHTTNSIQVLYRAAMTGAVSGGSYTEIDAGPAVDVIAYGAAARIAMGKEAPKVLYEDQSAGEYSQQAGDRLALAAYLDNQYRLVLNHWGELLWAESPPMGRVI
jgi:hypothetical protein